LFGRSHGIFGQNLDTEKLLIVLCG